MSTDFKIFVITSALGSNGGVRTDILSFPTLDAAEKAIERLSSLREHNGAFYLKFTKLY